MFRDRRFFRAVEAAPGFSDVCLSTTACDPVHHVGYQCVRKLVFHSGQRLSEGSLSGEHCSASCVNQRERVTQYWASPSEERRKTIWLFCCCLLGYFCDAFSHHWDSCWSWKHSEQCRTPSLFHNFEVSQGARSHSLKHYGFQFGTLPQLRKPHSPNYQNLATSIMSNCPIFPSIALTHVVIDNLHPGHQDTRRWTVVVIKAYYKFTIFEIWRF